MRGLSSLVSFLFMAACLVDENVTQNSERADQALKSFFQVIDGGGQHDEDRWLKRCKAGILRVVNMIDQIYYKIGDPAFELLVYMYLKPNILQHVSKYDISYTVALFQDGKWGQPEKNNENLEAIGNALGTSLSGNTSFTADTLSPDVPGLRHDPIRDKTHSRLLTLETIGN
ncbi:hypothetical protein FSARC_574 [Fusarium sarcochroum]|uniref:Uncharacterized protein n=1 Tax=Fusarium sarcochroum TaxID=1208366 RepID=A0A8H4UAV7_9HYPO|nr:hypothetical protein FSARC_574 [Fusarium sarcochroum]